MAAQPVYAEDRTIRRALRIIETRMKHRPNTIDGFETASNFLRLLLAGKEREEFWALWLDSRHALIEAELLAYGTVNVTAVYPREAVKAALRHNAVAVIFAHNHPSGNPEPSDMDHTLTSVLREALALIGVSLIDHLVVTSNETRSVIGVSCLKHRARARRGKTKRNARRRA